MIATTPLKVSSAPAPRVRVRWKIFGFVFAFGLLAYVQQRGITIAAYQMMPQLGLSQVQIGALETALLIGYTLMQFPGGVLGQRLGARWILVLIGAVGFLATLATPLAPLILASGALLAVLCAAQMLLGLSQGPLNPVAAGVFEAWFTEDRWPLVNGLLSMGLGLGAALTPPLIAWLMSAYGWQRALAASTLPALALILLWAWYGRDTPREHPAVSAAELNELTGPLEQGIDRSISWPRIGELLRNRDVLTLTGSYLCLNYVFYLLANWSFLYLVQERHFTVLEGGWLAALPPLGAALGAGLGGSLACQLSARYGTRRGLAIVPLLSLPAAGALLLLAVAAGNAHLAVAALTACFAAVELNEGPFWAAVMHIGRTDSMAASGILNTGGNVGGLVATPVVAYLSGHGAWYAAFAIGAAFAVASGVAWLFIDPLRELPRSAAAGGLKAQAPAP